MIERFGLGRQSRSMEIASNDGYLLQYFVRGGVPVLGIEPAANVAAVARREGHPDAGRFFGAELAARAGRGGPPGRPARSATTCWPRCRT